MDCSTAPAPPTTLDPGDAAGGTGTGSIGLRTSEDRCLTVPLRWAADGRLEHGYALTCHKAQGLTVEHTLVYGTGALSQQSGYVAMSRGRVSNHIYTALDAGRGRGRGPAHHELVGPDDPGVLPDRLRALTQDRRQHLASTHLPVESRAPRPAWLDQPDDLAQSIRAVQRATATRKSTAATTTWESPYDSAPGDTSRRRDGGRLRCHSPQPSGPFAPDSPRTPCTRGSWTQPPTPRPRDARFSNDSNAKSTPTTSSPPTNATAAPNTPARPTSPGSHSPGSRHVAPGDAQRTWVRIVAAVTRRTRGSAAAACWSAVEKPVLPTSTIRMSGLGL